MVLSGVLPHHVLWNVAGSLHVAGGAAFAGVTLLAGPATLEGSQFGACALLSHHADAPFRANRTQSILRATPPGFGLRFL